MNLSGFGRRPRLPTSLSRNRRRISTSVPSTGEAPRFRQLADMARAAGCSDVTPVKVHEWRMDGLVPSVGAQVSAGRAGFVTVANDAAEEQLLALCRHRRTTKSWDRLAVLLWLDGWAIQPERVRRAILKRMPLSLPRRTLDETFLDQLGQHVLKRGPALVRKLGLGRLRTTDAADGVFLLLVRLLGLATGLNEEAARAIEVALGVSPRARRETGGGGGPWLTGPAAAGLAPLFQEFSFGGWRSCVESASDVEIEQARGWARMLARDLPAALDAAEHARGRNAFGLGVVRIFSREPILAPAAALYFARQGYRWQLDELVSRVGASGLGAEPIE